ncbi:MAG: M56 family metallopeptidase [Dyadobacter sp.]|uniref:M56 family metallopeptidase n=1 Tax=Dyadobacter sp. TaxID=1914288 RepID=UPI003267F815
MLFLYLMKVSMLLAILTLGYRWLIQFETFSKLNRALLWLNVAAAWSLPLIPLADWGPVEVQAEFHQTIPKIAEAIPVVRQEISSFNPAPSIINRQHLPQWNFMDVLTLIYLAGVAFTAAIFLFQVGRLIRLLWKSPSQKSTDGVIFICDEHNTSPYSFFRWVIYNPQNHSKSTLQHILAHETEHVLQCHSLDLLLAELQRIVLWFNPFAWFHQRLVQANLEYLADRGVLDRGCEKKEYQFDLLRTVLQNRELPLTNSFAQSLLKKRIRMMNKKPSHYLAWGKYGLLIGILYLSSAFVAPYTAKVTEFLPPLVGVVFEAPSQTDAQVERPIETKQNLIPVAAPKAITTIDSSQTVKPEKVKSKWIVEQNGTLYYAISPLATWDDINEIKKEVKRFGAEMNINSIEYDPLQKFITHLTVHIETKGGSSKATEGEGKFVPMKGESGYIGKSQMGTGGDQPQLVKALQDDYDKALEFAKAHETEYFEYRLVQKINDEKLGSSSRGLEKGALEGEHAAEILSSQGVGKSKDNLLKLTSMHRDAECYLDSQPTTLSELNELPFSKFKAIKIIRDSRGKEYIIVYSK